MKKISVLLISVFFILNSPLYAQNFKEKQEKNIVIAEAKKELRVGETLVYSVQWLGIPVGKIVLKTEGIEEINGYACYHITAQALPNNFFRHFYDIEYKIDSYIDTKYFYTRRFEKTRRINKEYNYVHIDFNQEKKEARFKTWGSNLFMIISPDREKAAWDKEITAQMPQGTQDLLSSFYYFRLSDIKEGANYAMNIYYAQRNWPIDMKIALPFWKEIRKIGRFPLIKVYPNSDLNDYILGKRDFSFYITVDSRRIPVEFKLSTALGPVRGIIHEIP